MKRLFLIIICSTILLPLLSAQEAEAERKGYIGLSVGPAIPVGEFGSTDIGGDYSGFAKTGLSFQLVNFGYRLGKNLGIAGLWSGASFNVDLDAMVNNAGLGSFSVSSDPWGYGSFMGGLFVNFPSDKLDIDLRGLIGFGYGMAPEMTISGYDIDGSYAVIWQKSATAYAFAFDIGAGLRYHVSRLICLNLLLDYMASQPSFEIDMFINNEYLGASTFDQPMNHITLTAGVGFRLK